MDDQKSAPYLDGWHAHRLGVSILAGCPHDEKTQAYSFAQWQYGWADRSGHCRNGQDTSDLDGLHGREHGMLGRLKVTYELVRDQSGDPLWDQEHQAEPRIEGSSVFVPGSWELVVATELKITPDLEGWAISYRDPEECPPEQACFGREWIEGGTYLYWGDLVGFAYTL